jgi:WD40 repeat protein
MIDSLLAHPDREQLAALKLGLLSEAEALAVLQHLGECDGCRSAAESAPDDTLAALVRASVTPPDTTHALDSAGGKLIPGTADASSIPAALADHPRYRVLELLGHGGMGAVYKAEHRLMERTVALKVINRELTDRPAVVERFRREVKAAARLDHPNIVRAFDAERAEDTHLFVMECVEGTTLARLVADRGPLPVAEACDHVRQAALGLQHAFEHGMVHRDVKPHNLMVTPGGTVKVLDFGLARLASELASAGPTTSSGIVLGTADHIAPEQADNPHAADTRADIYALGCTLYFLLTGQPPFPEGTLMQKLLAHSKRSFRPVSDFRGDVPAGLVEVLDRMTAKDPAQRYQTPGEVARTLAPFATKAVADPGVNTQVAPARSRPRRRRFRPALAAALALLLLGGALLGVIAYRIATDRGEFVIEVDDEEVEVLLAKHGLMVKDRKTGREYQLKPGRHILRTGDYEIEVTEQASGLEFSTREFRITRGGKTRVKVTLKRSAIKVGEVRRFEGHTGAVRSVAISCDGRFVLSGSGFPDGDQTLRLWDTRTGKELRRFTGHTGQVLSVAFSSDGKHALSGSSDATVRLWDVASGKELHCFTGHRGLVQGVAFSPDGRHALSGSVDFTVRLWDITSGKELRCFAGHTHRVQSVAFSPDGKRVLSGGWDSTVRLWDVTTGEELRRFAGHTSWVNGVAFSPDGRHVLSGSLDHSVRLWDVGAGKEVRRFGGHTRSVESVAFSPDGRWALSGGRDSTVRLWDVATGKELRCFTKHTDVVFSVAFSHDGRLALSGSGGIDKGVNDWAAGSDWTVRLWRLPDPPPPEKVGEVRRFEGHGGGVMTVAISPDGRLAISGEHGAGPRAAVLWDVATGKELRRLQGHTTGIHSVAFSHDGKRVLTAGKDLRLWDLETGRVLQRLWEPPLGMGAVLSPDGKSILRIANDHTLRLQDVGSGKELKRFEGHPKGGVRAVAISPDGRLGLSGGLDNAVRLWDLATGKEIRCFREHTGWVISVAFSPDGRLALSGAVDKTVRLWDVATGKEVRRFVGHAESVHTVAFCPDGRRALSGGYDQTVRLWDVATGKELHRFLGHTGPVWSVACSPDGRYALSGSADRTMRLWRLPDPPPEKVGMVRTVGTHGNSKAVWAVAFFPDGGRAVSCGDDGQVRCWDLTIGCELWAFDCAADPPGWKRPRIVAVSPDGSRVLVAVYDSTVRVLDAKTGQEVGRFTGHKALVDSVAISSDGKLAVSASNEWRAEAPRDCSVRVWEVTTGKELFRIDGPEAPRKAVFSPDDRFVLSGWQRDVILSDAKTGKEVRRFKGHEGAVLCTAFSPDGRRGLSAGWEKNPVVRVWDIGTGMEIAQLVGHTDKVQAVAFRADGRQALTASEDGSLRLWDVGTGKELCHFSGRFQSAALSPDGKYALSCGKDGTVRLWRLPDPPAGEGRRAYLGVQLATEAKACEIAAINLDSPAEKAGLKAGDVVLKLDGQKVSDSDDFISQVARKKPGETVKLEVRRDKEVMTIKVTLGKRNS